MINRKDFSGGQVPPPPPPPFVKTSLQVDAVVSVIRSRKGQFLQKCSEYFYLPVAYFEDIKIGMTLATDES
jgi:hypothetical protein